MQFNLQNDPVQSDNRDYTGRTRKELFIAAALTGYLANNIALDIAILRSIEGAEFAEWCLDGKDPYSFQWKIQ